MVIFDKTGENKNKGKRRIFLPTNYLVPTSEKEKSVGTKILQPTKNVEQETNGEIYECE
jgi:hypothetical protein